MAVRLDRFWRGGADASSTRRYATVSLLKQAYQEEDEFLDATVILGGLWRRVTTPRLRGGAVTGIMAG